MKMEYLGTLKWLLDDDDADDDDDDADDAFLRAFVCIFNLVISFLAFILKKTYLYWKLN